MQNVGDKSNVPQSDSIDNSVHSLVSKRSSDAVISDNFATDENENDDLLQEDSVHWIVRSMNRLKRSLGFDAGAPTSAASNDETTKIKSKRKRNNQQTEKPKKLSKTKEKLSSINLENDKSLSRPKRR